MPLWSNDELSDVFKCVATVGPVTNVLCSTLGLTKGQVDGIRRRYPTEWAEAVERWDEKHPKISPEAKNQHLRQNIQLRQTQSELKRQLDAAIKEESLGETIRIAIEQNIPALTPLQDYPERITPNSGTVEETLVMLVSDLHLGETVKPERVKFLNEFNDTVCQQRWGHYVESVLKIKEKMEAGGGWHFPELVIPLLGDMVTGSIHNLEMDSEQTVVKSCMSAAAMIAEGIAFLAQHFPEVHVMGVAGNHARLPDRHKKAYKEPTRNWDSVVYYAIAQYLRNVPNVKCFFPESFFIQADLRGHRFQFAHGDDIQSFGSFPIYGLSRHVMNQNSGESARGEHISYFCMGHFHQKNELGFSGAELLINGDFVGTTEYVLGKLGQVGIPRQVFFGVHKDHGISHRWEVRLSSPSPTAPLFAKNPWEPLENDIDGQPIQIYTVGAEG